MKRSLKRKLVVGGAAVAVAAFAGGAYAATQNSGPSSRQAFLNDVAKRLHVTPQQLSSALNGAYADQLQAAVKDGRLTQAQANALQQRLKQGGAPPAVPFGFFGPRPRGFPVPPLGGVGPRLGGVGIMAGPGSLHSVAAYLGLNEVQLLQQLSSGKSLAQVATAKGKSVSGLEQAIKTGAKAGLDKLVAAKIITAAQEQRILARIDSRVSAAVNQKGLPFKRAFRPRLRFPGGAGKLYGVPKPPDAPVPAPGTLPLPLSAPAPSA